MKITHHKNGKIKTLVDEAPYHPGYEDAGFKPKEMNNKPVAWMYACNGIWTAFSDELPPDDAYDEGTLTPLYTHPADLTDEEIQQAIDGIDWNQSNVLIRFARAILRKAQEK